VNDPRLQPQRVAAVFRFARSRDPQRRALADRDFGSARHAQQRTRVACGDRECAIVQQHAIVEGPQCRLRGFAHTDGPCDT
jgi:hypothetical protein